MNLQGIIFILGQPGLWKLIGRNKTQFIVESIAAKNVKRACSTVTCKVSSLAEIRVCSQNDDIPLAQVFEQFCKVKDIPDPKKTEATTLRNFFLELVPNHDQTKVYISDIKKIITWYQIIKEHTNLLDVSLETASQKE